MEKKETYSEIEKSEIEYARYLLAEHEEEIVWALISIQDINRYLFESPPNIHNISIAAFNKIIDLHHLFENKGISLYISHSKSEDESTDNTVFASFLGYSIIEDIARKCSDSILFLNNYNKTANEILAKKTTQLKKYNRLNSLLKPFRRIRMYLFPESLFTPLYKPKELAALSPHLKHYMQIYDEVANYSIENDLVASIVKFFVAHHYTPEILEHYVFPDLEQLGFAYLENQIKTQVTEACRTELSWKDSIVFDYASESQQLDFSNTEPNVLTKRKSVPQAESQSDPISGEKISPIEREPEH